MTKEIKLQRTDIEIPDAPTNGNGNLKIHVKYLDIANPLTDESGNIQYTNVKGEDGSPVPAYPEYTLDIDVPEAAEPSTELITSLIAAELETVKIKAQMRANAEEKKKVLKPFVDKIAAVNPVEFEGVVDISSITIE